MNSNAEGIHIDNHLTVEGIGTPLSSSHSFNSMEVSEEDIKSVLGMDDARNSDVIEATETELEDQAVEREDNEAEYKYNRKIYEILTIIMCCLFLFSTSYSKATTKNMQTDLPQAGIYDGMEPKELEAAIIRWIGYIEIPVIFISPVRFSLIFFFVFTRVDYDGFIIFDFHLYRPC